MDSKSVLLYVCGSIAWVLLCITNNVHAQSNVFKVTDFGAVSDGKTDSSKAFLMAWKQACATKGGVVAVPKGTYFVNIAQFQGPCNGATSFQIMGTIRAPSGIRYKQPYWISFYEVSGLTIYGGGIFDGNGASAWARKDSCPDCDDQRPMSIQITKVKNLNIRNIMSLNSKMFHFHIVMCDNVVVDNVNIRAPANSPNTDGIHIGRSNNVSVTNTRISTGDDCISFGDGMNNVNIESVTCGPGHGISIGSLGKYEDEEDVRGITVRNCTLINTTNGLRIKTWAPSSISSIVSDVTFENIKVYNVQNPIVIDQFYCPDSSCTHQRNSDVKINGVKFINIKGTSASEVGVNLQCSKSHPCQNLVFKGLDITKDGGESTAGICSFANFEFLGLNAAPSSCARGSF